MKIAIEAQRIFRPDKHGMDFVALESIRELQKRNEAMNTTLSWLRAKTIAWKNLPTSPLWKWHVPPTRFGNR